MAFSVSNYRTAYTRFDRHCVTGGIPYAVNYLDSVVAQWQADRGRVERIVKLEAYVSDLKRSTEAKEREINVQMAEMALRVEKEGGQLFQVNNQFLAVFWLPTFFTSVWIWLYAGSGFLLKFARRFDRLFQWFNRKFDIEKKPLSAIGLVAGALVALIYWGWSAVRGSCSI